MTSDTAGLAGAWLDLEQLINMVAGRQTNDAAPLDMLIDVLRKRFDRSTRINILGGLNTALRPDDGATLVRHLMEGDDPVQEMIVGALPILYYDFDDIGLIPALLEGIETGNGPQRRLLLNCLIDYKLKSDKEERARAPLLAAVNDPDSTVRALVIEALGWLRGNPPTVDMYVMNAIRHAAVDPDGEVRKAAAWSLGYQRDGKSVELLVELLTDPVAAVRAQAAYALTEPRDLRAVRPLRAALNDPHPAVRRRVVHALRWSSEPAPAFDLTRMLQDSFVLPVPTQGINTLPMALHQAVDRALSAMQAHPQHHLLPILRRPIYDGFGSHLDPTANRARALLALWTARHVLPAWERATPRDDEPQMSIVLGEERLAGIAMRGEAYEWGVQYGGGPGPDADEVGWPAVYALGAAVRALGEEEGWNSLDTLEEVVRLNHPTTDANHLVDADAPFDAAAEAAMSEASEGTKRNRHVQPHKLCAFWEWWLTELVPAAWAARDHPVG